MKRINVRRVLGLLACAFMLISSTLGGTTTVARAEETTEAAVEGGGLHFANGYDWRAAGDGHAHNIFAFASADATATSSTFTGQAAGFFNWWYGFVLEYNAEKGTYVVTVADMVASDGVCAAEAATLGGGKIVVAFHDEVVNNQADSFNYFIANVKEGAEFTLSCDFATLAAAAGALTDVTLTLVETVEENTAGGLHFANGYDWRAAGDGHAHNIFAFASADATATSSTFTGQAAGFFNWWYGFVLEYNAERGTYVVTVADMVASDGVCAAETATLGEGKIVVAFHDEAVNNQADSFNYFLANVKEGAEFTLSCDFATLAAAAGALSDVTLTLVETVEEENTAGGLHFANGYDWRAAGDGHAHNIFAFASADATATSSTFTGQAAGFFNWWYGFVLEYNAERGTYVVTVADMVPGDGVCAAETATLGEGKIVVAFHDEAVNNQADSFNYFLANVKEGAEFTLSCDFATLAAAAGALSDVTLTLVETVEEENTAGGLHFANGYDWRAAGDGHAHNIFAFASADATATSSTFTGQAAGFFNWWYGFVLEYNAERGTYVVTVADMVASDGVCAAESATLGEGKIVVAFHDGAAENQADSFNYFLANVKEGAEFTLSCDFATLAAAAGALTDVTLTLAATGTDAPVEVPAEPTPEPTPEPQIESTIGNLTMSNAYDWFDDHLKEIIVLTSDDPELEASGVLGQSSANNVFGWWYGLVLEYDEAKGAFVVTSADMNPDGVCTVEAEKLGYGKMVIMFYPDVKEKHPETVAYFLTHAEVGTEHYLVGNYDDMIWVYDKLADTYLTSEKPDSYWTKQDPTPTPEPTVEPTAEPTQTPEPTAEPTQAPAPVVQENPGMNPIVLAVIVVAVVAVAGIAVVILKKRK